MGKARPLCKQSSRDSEVVALSSGEWHDRGGTVAAARGTAIHDLERRLLSTECRHNQHNFPRLISHLPHSVLTSTIALGGTVWEIDTSHTRPNALNVPKSQTSNNMSIGRPR